MRCSRKLYAVALLEVAVVAVIGNLLLDAQSCSMWRRIGWRPHYPLDSPATLPYPRPARLATGRQSPVSPFSRRSASSLAMLTAAVATVRPFLSVSHPCALHTTLDAIRSMNSARVSGAQFHVGWTFAPSLLVQVISVSLLATFFAALAMLSPFVLNSPSARLRSRRPSLLRSSGRAAGPPLLP